MSDGPHRSLPMRAKWRACMRTALNRTHGDDEVQALFGDAIRHEFPVAAVRVVREIFSADLLFPSMRLDRLSEVADANPGVDSVSKLVDCSREAIRLGQSGDDGLRRALSEAGREVAHSHLLGMEEHAERKNAPECIERLKRAHESTSFEAFAAEYLDEAERPRRRAGTARRRGIDEGPSL